MTTVYDKLITIYSRCVAKSVCWHIGKLLPIGKLRPIGSFVKFSFGNIPLERSIIKDKN